MSLSDQDAYHEVCAYTLTHGDPAFIHQHVVDAWAAQAARPDGKPISLAFALAGLYLHLERQFTGRQVQQAHMQMARRKTAWPTFDLPDERGGVTARDVIAVAAGAERDQAIERWCASVWEAYAGQRERVLAFLRPYGLGPEEPRS
jgi:hypothetical protein